MNGTWEKGRWVGKLQVKLTKGPVTSGETEAQNSGQGSTRASQRVTSMELKARTTDVEVKMQMARVGEACPGSQHPAAWRA